MRSFMGILCLLVCLASGASARSWHVPADAATFEASLAMAAPADTLVLAAGVYYVHDVQINRGIVLRGETGVAGDVILDAEMQCRVMTAV